jgi:phosphoenolpyruvate carboxykinase (ATP)
LLLLLLLLLLLPFCLHRRAFLATRQTAVDYLNLQDRVYVVDGYAGWDASVSLQMLLLQPRLLWLLLLLVVMVMVMAIQHA